MCIRCIGLVALFGLAASAVLAEEKTAPAPNPPVNQQRVPPAPPVSPSLQGGGATLYSIGDPTDEEQLMLEYVNRARADASAEAARLKMTTDADTLEAYDYFSVDLDQMTNQFAALTRVLPPLSMNARLLAASRLHSQDMFNNQFQGHTSSTNPPAPDQPGDSPGNRVDRQGYVWQICGENVYATGDSVGQSHAGFDVDWGGPTYGMQDPPGHRLNIHSSNYWEIGIGIVTGLHGAAGPYVVTEDFAATSSPAAFITGVAYYDMNTNGFYDLGEGLGGVEVSVAGNPAGAVTAVSGGYSVPVPGSGAYTVTFRGTNLADLATNVTVSGSRNVKLDYAPTYQPPLLVGSAVVCTGAVSHWTVQGLGGITNYDVLVLALNTNAWTEGGETGTNFVTLATSPGYTVIQSAAVHAGTHAFHLAHPTHADQTVTLNRRLYLGTNAVLRFYSSLGWATTSEVASVNLSTDDGVTWTPIYLQYGTDNGGETLTFHSRQVSLAAWARQRIRLQFVYAVGSGSYYIDTDADVGWLLDDISVSDAREYVEQDFQSIGLVSSFDWNPPAAGWYLLTTRGTYDRRVFPYGAFSELYVTALRLVLSGLDCTNAAACRVGCRVEYGSPLAMFLEQAERAGGSVQRLANPVQGPVNGEYFFDGLTPTNAAFFRVTGW